MKGGDKLRRRTKKIWVPRENSFICGACGVKGGCSDEKTSKKPFFWDEIARKITCVKCGHQLTTKKELEELLEVEEIQTYGFWIRFVSEHFIPCKKCQDRIDGIFMVKKISLRMSNPNSVSLHVSRDSNDYIEFMFALGFAHPSPILNVEFRPCDKCQGKLLKLFNKSEMHIGNDTKPLVELWRKWYTIDEWKNL